MAKPNDNKDVIYDGPALRRALGDIVAQHRLDNAMQQRVFGRMAGIDNSHVRSIEQGESNFTFSTYLKIASALDRDPSELLQEAIERARRSPRS